MRPSCRKSGTVKGNFRTTGRGGNLPRDPMFFQLPVERAPGYAEHLGGLDGVPPETAHRLDEEHPLQGAEVARVLPCGALRPRVAGRDDLGREMTLENLVAVGGVAQVLDAVPQLPDISGPVVRREPVERPFRDPFPRRSVPPRAFPED